MSTPIRGAGAGGDEPGGPIPSPPGPAVAGRRRVATRASILAAGLVGGLLSAWLTALIPPPFAISAEAMRRAGGMGGDFTAYNRERAIAEGRNAGVSNALFGLVVGASLGAAGLAASRRRDGLAAPAAGGLLGLALGGLTPLALVPYFLRHYDPVSPDLILPGLVHLGIWGPVGLAGGLGLGLGLDGRPGAARGAVGGLIGVVVGTVLFEVGHALLLPLERVEEAMPVARLPRLASFACIGLAVAAGAASAAGLPGRGARPDVIPTR